MGYEVAKEFQNWTKKKAMHQLSKWKVKHPHLVGTPQPKPLIRPSQVVTKTKPMKRSASVDTDDSVELIICAEHHEEKKPVGAHSYSSSSEKTFFKGKNTGPRKSKNAVHALSDSEGSGDDHRPSTRKSAVQIDEKAPKASRISKAIRIH